MRNVRRQKQWAERWPDLGTSPLPRDPYDSEEYFAIERDLIFCWTRINVGRIDEIPNAGDDLVSDIAICKNSELVLRGLDGIVRDVHNVCSHWSNTLAPDERGSCSGSLYCHIHNWISSDTGELIRVRDEENFSDLNKCEHRLMPAYTDI